MRRCRRYDTHREHALKTFPDLIVCGCCDTVYRRPVLRHGESYVCQSCNAPLFRRPGISMDAWLALSVATAVAFFIANVCPVVRIGFQGAFNDATLGAAVWALCQDYTGVIAIPAAFAAIVAPATQIALLTWVLFHARQGRLAPGFARAMRVIAAMRHWSMVEVALLGVFVTMIKLSATLHVQPLSGVWALTMSMIGLTVIANRDMHAVWSLAEQRSRPLDDGA